MERRFLWRQTVFVEQHENAALLPVSLPISLATAYVLVHLEFLDISGTTQNCLRQVHSHRLVCLRCIFARGNAFLAVTNDWRTEAAHDASCVNVGGAGAPDGITSNSIVSAPRTQSSRTFIDAGKTRQFSLTAFCFRSKQKSDARRSFTLHKKWCTENSNVSSSIL